MERQIVADESVDFRIVIRLRELGFTVYSICEQQPSIKDQEVLQIAVSYEAILLTEDKDFGELVFRLQLSHRGILLIRIKDPEAKIHRVADTILKYFTEISNKFSVLNETKLRIKE